MSSDNDTIPAYEVADETTVEFQSPEHPWYFAQILDWIILHPGIDHAACRVYSTFVSVATKQSQFRRRLTLDQVRWLVPGVNNKPMSQSTFRNALKVLDLFTLVTVKPYSGKTEQVRDARTGRFTKQESVLFQVGKMPPNPETFDGWCNVFDKLEAYPGLGWDKLDTQPKPSTTSQDRAQNSAHGIDSRAQNSDDGTDQVERDGAAEVVDNSHRAQNSGDRAQNFGSRAQNSVRASAVPSENGGYQYSPPTQFSNTPGGPAPLDPPVAGEPNGSPAPDTAGHSASGVTNQGVLCKDHQTARARAGAAALAAVEANPTITESELAAVITSGNDRLVHSQAFGRAARLLAWERKPGSFGDRKRHQTPA